MKVVVTGGAGFIGSHLCDALIARGDDVVCIDNLVGTGGSTRNIDHLWSSPRFRFSNANVEEYASRLPFGLDVIFHQAASKATVCRDDPERDLRVNALATLRLATAAAEAGVTFVHASTGSVTDIASFYGVSKAAGEHYVRLIGEQTGMPWTVLRYYHVIGPRQSDADTGGVVPIFVRRALAGEPLVVHGTGEQIRSFTSVHDVVRANLFVADNPQRRVLTCASGIRVSVNDLAVFVRSDIRDVPIEYGPRRDGDVDEFAIDNSAIRELGIEFDTDWRSVVRSVADVQAVAA